MSEKTNPLDTLDVTVNGELAGVLHTSERNRYTFTYDRKASASIMQDYLYPPG